MRRAFRQMGTATGKAAGGEKRNGRMSHGPEAWTNTRQPGSSGPYRLNSRHLRPLHNARSVVYLYGIVDRLLASAVPGPPESPSEVKAPGSASSAPGFEGKGVMARGVDKTRRGRLSRRPAWAPAPGAWPGSGHRHHHGHGRRHRGLGASGRGHRHRGLGADVAMGLGMRIGMGVA
jgi:hypothetical protein